MDGGVLVCVVDGEDEELCFFVVGGDVCGVGLNGGCFCGAFEGGGVGVVGREVGSLGCL